MRLVQNQPVAEIIQDAHSPLSQEGEGCVHTLCKCARCQRQSKLKESILVSHPLEHESHEFVIGGCEYENKHLSDPQRKNSPLGKFERGFASMLAF